MDYRALAEFITTSVLSFAALVLVMGFTARVFVVPTLRELFGNRGESRREDRNLIATHLARIEDRLDALDHAFDQLNDTRSFERALRDMSEEDDAPSVFPRDVGKGA